MGSLQAARHRPRRRSVPSARQGRLPAGQDELDRHCERSEAIQTIYAEHWIASFASLLAMTKAAAKRARQNRTRFLVEPSSSGASSVLEFERDVELGAVGFDLAFGIQLQIELDDFGDAKIPEGLPRPLERGRGRLLP